MNCIPAEPGYFFLIPVYGDSKKVEKIDCSPIIAWVIEEFEGYNDSECFYVVPVSFDRTEYDDSVGILTPYRSVVRPGSKDWPTVEAFLRSEYGENPPILKIPS